MPFSGQLWYITEGGDAATRLVRINDDGTGSTIVADNGGAGTGDDKFPSSFTADIGVDTAAGFYFAIASSNQDDHAFLMRGTIGSAAAPVIVVDFPDNILVNTIQLDAINHKIYAGYQDGSATPNGNITGIRVYSYDPLTGAVTDNGFLTTAVTDNRPNESGFFVLDPQDFALDASIGRLFYSERVDGLTVGLFRLDLATPNVTTRMVDPALFPGNMSNGQIIDVEVDQTTDLVYFTTRSQYPSPLAGFNANNNALWYISENASNGTPTKVTLVGLPPAHVFYGGDMTFDQSTRQIYLESEETSTATDTDDVIYVFQLNAAGTAATLIRTINPGLTLPYANLEGMTFTDLAALAVSGTGTVMNEQQAAATILLTGAPTITDNDGGYLVGATVQITAGTFSSNESSSADDHLGYGAGKQVAGLIGGTNITLSWNAASETLTLTGYDTIANYQSALSGIAYWATGDNPTNYGLNSSRTITWTVNDGTPGVLPGSVNSSTSTINIAAVNDAPVNGTVSSASGNAGVNIAVTGLQISDVDANPGATAVSVALSVANGVVTLRTNVAGGLTAGDLAGNGTGSVTVTGTLNAINATLAAANGLVYLNNAGFSGTDTLTVVTNDGGNTGSGGALSDSDGYTITVVGPNAAPVAAGTAVLAAANEDTAAPGGQTVSTVFAPTFSDTNGGDTLAGVAITGNAVTSQGVWQYFNGAWTTVGFPSEGSALVLAAGTLVRFLPAANFNGAVPALTAYLIDSSGGAVTTGSFLNVSVNGGITRFSDVSTTLTTSIGAVNDTPVVPATATTVGATEQTAAILLGSVTVSDVDLDARNGGNGDYAGASFTVQRAAANAADAFSFGAGGLFTVSGANLQVGAQTFATFISVGGVLTISFTSAAATATTALANDVIRHITYTNASNAPPSSVTLNYALNDGAPGGGQGAAGAASAGGAVIVNITAVNDAHTGGASITGTAAEDQVLTAVSTLVDADGIGTLHYQWQHDVGGGYVNVGSDQATYTLGDGDIGGVVRVVLYYTDAGGTVESATSAATAAVTAANDAPTGGVSLTGTVTENQVLTANTATLADSDGLGTLHYDWQRDTGSGFVSIGAADQATYTLGDADVGGVVRVVVSYTDGQGFANSVTSAASAAVAGVNDPHTGGASITGTATEDQVLTAASTLADVDGLGTLHYQWQRDTGGGFVNVGTDQATYTLGDAEVGGLVRVVTSYTDGQGFAESSTSPSTAAIANINDAPTGAVAITGTVTENQVLTANTAALADIDGLGTLHYQWQRNAGAGFFNVGADVATYTLGAADVGATVRIVVSYVDGQGTGEAVTSAATAAVANLNDAPTGSVSITGTAMQASVLTAANTLADLDGLGPISYQWRANGVAIAGAVASTFAPGQAQVGTTITVTASYTDLQGTAEAVTSGATAAVANVNDSPTGGVAIAGTKTVGSTLSASNSLADADGLGAIGYEWLRDGVAISGATAGSYVVGGADVGKTISVRASYIDGYGTPESATSVGIVGEAAPVTPGGPGTPPTAPTSKLTIEALRFDAPPVNGTAPKIQLTLVADSLAGEIDPDPSTAYLTRFGQGAGPDAGRAAANALGTLDFKADLSQAGNTETFSLIFDNAVAQNGFWVADSKGHWVNLADPLRGGSANVTGSQMRLDFKITDGGEFDLDGLANGSITASGFVAMTNLSIIGHVPDSGDSFALF